MVIRKASGKFATIYNDIEGTGDDQVDIVVITALLDDGTAGRNIDQQGRIGYLFCKHGVTGNDLLVPERFDQRPPAVFAFESLYHPVPPFLQLNTLAKETSV
jgi:hypothetical protein